MRGLRLAVAAVTLGVVAATGAGAAVHADDVSGPCGPAVTSAGHGWLAMHPPFPKGGAAVTLASAVPFQPDRIYATNGTVLMRSDDAGCSWHLALDVSQLPAATVPGAPAAAPGLPLSAPARIDALAAPSSATSSDHVYVGVTSGTAPVTSPVVEVSADAGGHWQSGSGLPTLGSVREVTASPINPGIGYAIVGGVAGVTDTAVYATTDGGATWARRGYSASASTTFTRLRTNPVVATMLFALGPDGVESSSDGGNTFTTGTRPGRDVASYDVAVGNGYMLLVQGHTGRRAYDRSDDGGATWTSVRTPVDAAEVAVAPIVGAVAVTDHHHLWVMPASPFAPAVPVTPAIGPPGDLQFSAPLGNGLALTGVARGAVVRAVLSPTATSQQPTIGLTPIRLLSQTLPHRFPSTMLPARTALRLPAGSHRDVAYTLVLPRTPSPVDVMFLVDTTDSMQPTIDALRQDIAAIVAHLGEVGLDVRFGLGDFKDYPRSVGGREGDGSAGDYPYRLDRAIGLADGSLRRALSGLNHRGGGDPPEADLTALYQSTTGAGQRVGRHVLVRAGQQARYRPGSLRLAVIATDAPYHHERRYLTPSWTSTVAALLAAGVHQIGLAVPDIDAQGRPTGYPSMHDEQLMATDTGATAPPGGVDCNDDLVVDIPAGDPVVCRVPAQSTPQVGVAGHQLVQQSTTVDLTSAIVTSAETIPDLRPVVVRVDGARASVARVVAPRPLPTVDVRADNLVGFTVRYTCPVARTPHVYRLTVRASAGVRAGASSTTALACGAVAPPARRLPVPPLAAAAPPLAAAAAPAPPGNPLPNANPNPNPALNANVGVAAQDEQQRQLAFAEADPGVDETTELAMSRPADDPGGPLLVGAAAVMAAGAAGYALRSRLRLAWHR